MDITCAINPKYQSKLCYYLYKLPTVGGYAFSDYPGLLVCSICFLVIRVISLEFVNTHNFSFFLAYHSGGNTKFRLTPSNLIEIGKQVWSQWHHPRKQSEKVLPISVNRFMVLKPSSLAVHFPIKLPFLSCSCVCVLSFGNGQAMIVAVFLV